jgi:hypothetical protein
MRQFLVIIVLLFSLMVRAQPIMPVLTAPVGDTNEVDVPQVANATLAWNRASNTLQYRWTNWNAWTNQGGVTTNLRVTNVTMVLGTNKAGVRAEAGTNVSAWSMITNLAVATNAVGILGIQTRSMVFKGAAWGPWLTTTQAWYDTSQFQKQWRPIIVNSNWWRLDKL